SAPRPRRRLYDDAVREALILLWEASDRICGKRLKPLIPMLVAAMERHGHLALDPAVRERLEVISAATIDRILAPVRREAGSRGRRRRAASSEIRRAVPIRTYADWNDPPPGFFEADLVSHSGPLTSGSFTQTLVLTDIASGWTECAPLLFREQQLLAEVLTVLRGVMPLPIL
ncbi:transposase, partial [Cereibacter changlensis]